MIRILQIIGSLERGGAETFLINLYRNIDRERIQFDFAIYNEPTEKGYYEEVIKMGAKVYLIPPKKDGIYKNLDSIRKIVKENDYKYVWRHTPNCFMGMDLIAAKLGGASKLILHSHNTNVSGKKFILHYFLRPLVNQCITARFACGQAAGKWMFGRRDYRVICNGINVDKFRLSESIRNSYRDKYGLAEKTVIGHIGRFCEVKNHTFLVKVFSEYINKNPQAVLILVGGGPLEEEIKLQVKECDLEDKILFLGVREDISELFQMMDIFMFPSLYEGLPVTLIEAQVAGVPCIVSSAVSKEADLSGEIEYLDLEAPVNVWVETIEKKIGKRYAEAADKVKNMGYDIYTVARELEDILEKM